MVLLATFAAATRSSLRLVHRGIYARNCFSPLVGCTDGSSWTASGVWCSLVAIDHGRRSRLDDPRFSATGLCFNVARIYGAPVASALFVDLLGHGLGQLLLEIAVAAFEVA